MSDNNQPRNEASASLCPLSSQSEPDAASVSTTAASAAAPPTSPLAIPRDLPADTVHFGTDGWRAIIGEDFNTATLARLAEATARVFREDNPLGDKGDACPASPPCANTLYIGYDCRSNAGRYAVLVAAVVAEHGFDVRVCDSYCPTPTLCWSVARDPAAAGGIMLTSSHNPAEYLGVKLRMPDGGASPKEFSDRVEAALVPELPSAYERALSLAELAKNATPGQRATEIPVAPEIVFQDLVGPYLNELYTLVDAEAIRAAGLRVVVDPLFGAGRGYLAALLTALGVKVAEVNNTNDPSFAGLHPEPILPWIKGGLEQTVALGYDACLITDGDADRIGAGDAEGNFVNPHRILALLIAHLAAPAPAPAAPGDTPVPAPAAPTSRLKGTGRRVVRTFSGSNLVKRQCERLGLELTTTPIGFKWIYGEMLAGDVLIGGEESGGIGIPTHVRERDGLLMALLLTELMAQTGKALGELVADLLHSLGNFDFARRDLRLSEETKEAFVRRHSKSATGVEDYRELFVPLGETLVEVDHLDGVKLSFASDAWLLLRPSGTEPLVRVYAEASTTAQVEKLLDIGVALASAS